MLNFTPVTAEAMTLLRPYYETCTYRLCEYSAGVKYMWRDHLHSEYAIADGCLIIRNRLDGVTQFDYPIPGPGGDVEAALATVEDDCRQRGVRPIFSVVPESEAGKLALRWPRVTITNERVWKDYLYRAEDLARFAGRHYSGQRNHINKFNKEHPGAEFIPLTAEDSALLETFWADYGAEFQKQSSGAKRELALAQEMFTHLDTGIFRAGGILWQGRLLAVALAEKCGDTLVCHVEKALYSHAGVYPAMVQLFAGYYGGIIQRIKSIQPEAKIFVVTRPRDGVDDTYNVPIRQMAEIFSNVYVIDLYKYAPDYSKGSDFARKFMLGGHLNAAGYQYTAWMFMTYIDWIVRNNMDDFAQVGFIGTGLRYNAPNQ